MVLADPLHAGLQQHVRFYRNSQRNSPRTVSEPCTRRGELQQQRDRCTSFSARPDCRFRCAVATAYHQHVLLPVLLVNQPINDQGGFAFDFELARRSASADHKQREALR